MRIFRSSMTCAMDSPWWGSYLSRESSIGSFRPAEADFRQSAKRFWDAIIGKPWGHPRILSSTKVLAATQKEVKAGHVRGPISDPSDGTVARRFGVRQGEPAGGPKVRPIDDYRKSVLNAAVVQTEQVPVHSLDVVAAALS